MVRHRLKAIMGTGAVVVMATFIQCGRDETPATHSSPSPGATLPSSKPSVTPSSSPAASPTPVATDPRISPSCSKLGPGVAEAKCIRDIATYQTEVDGAISLLRTQRPDIFDGDQVLSTGAYIVGVIKNLDAQGICAYWDGDELAVKKEDWFSDQYDVLTSRALVHQGVGSYAVTCYPAWFPPPSDGQFVSTPTPGCKLPPSYWVTCGGEPNHRYEAALQSSIDFVIANYPQYFDMVRLNPSTGQPLVVNGEGLVQKMQEYLQGKGYCTKWDDEEIQIKGSNEFSEHYDFLLSSGHIRRESYASVCYPAAF